MAIITITETSQTLDTVLPNGNLIRSEALPLANASQHNVIGEKKRWKINYTSNVSILGNTIYINPALFVPSGAIPNFTPPGASYYSYKIPEAGGVNITYECALNSAGRGTKMLKNYRVAIHVTNPTTFYVIVEFYMTYDANGFLDAQDQDNISRFFKDIKTNLSDRVASDPDSVYTSEDRAAKCMVYLEKYNGDNGYIVSTTNFKGIFYGAGSLTNGRFVMKRDGVEVDTISSTENTTLEFYIDSPGGVQNVVIWVVDVTETDPTKDFLQNYDYDAVLAYPGAPNSNKIIGPMVSPQLVDPANNTYRTIVLLDGPSMPRGHRFSFFAIAYETVSASFSSGAGVSLEPSDVVDTPCFDGTGFNLDGRLRDYNIEWSGNDLEACIEERMQSVLQMEFTGDKWKNYLASRLSLVGSNDIRRYLTQINCTIYREFIDASSNLIKHIYATGTVNKTSPLVYTPTADIAASFPNDGTAEFTFDWRNRYEAAIANIQSLINGINVPPFDDQYWGGKAFKVEWELKFFYDDYFSPFTDIVRYTQKLNVLDYDSAGIMTITKQGEADSVDVCFGSDLCLNVTSPNPTEDYKLIATIEAAPGNIGTIEEAENWVGNELTQETTNKIIDEEEDFGETSAGVAKFCVDTTKIILNLPYKITAIAKPNVEGCVRATEILEDRETEVNETRVPEECFN